MIEFKKNDSRKAQSGIVPTKLSSRRLEPVLLYQDAHNRLKQEEAASTEWVEWTSKQTSVDYT